MARYTFWLLMAACLFLAGGMYWIKVRGSVQDVEEATRDLSRTLEQARRKAEHAVGPAMVATLEKRQKAAEEGFTGILHMFQKRDRENLDRWFPALQKERDVAVDWKHTKPLREDFKQEYALAYDSLQRELSAAVREFGMRDVNFPLREYGWMKAGDLPPEAELRHLQREFWVQDRVFRAFARHGAVPARPIRGLETQAAVPSGGRAPFNRIRFDVTVRCPAERLEAVLHALDAPFDVVRASGARETMALNCVIDNLAVKRLNVDGGIARRHPEEPPVEVTFFITVLDYEEAS